MKKKILIKNISDSPFICNHDTGLMIELLNGNIADRNRGRLAKQLDNCPQCRDTLNQLSQTNYTASNKKNIKEGKSENISAPVKKTDSLFYEKIPSPDDKLHFLLISESNSDCYAEQILPLAEKIFLLTDPVGFSYSTDNMHFSFDHFVRICFPDNNKKFDCAFIPELNELSSSFAGYMAEQGRFVLCCLPADFSAESKDLIFKMADNDKNGNIIFLNKERIKYHSLVIKELVSKNEIGNILSVYLNEQKQFGSLISDSGDSGTVFSSEKDIFNTFQALCPSFDLIQWLLGVPVEVIAKPSVPYNNIKYLSLAVILSYSNGMNVNMNFSPFAVNGYSLKIDGTEGSLEFNEKNLIMKKKSVFLNSTTGEGVHQCFIPEKEYDHIELALLNLNDAILKRSEFYCTSESFSSSLRLMDAVVESIYNDGATVVL